MFFQSKHEESAPGQSFDKENNVVNIYIQFYNFLENLKIYLIRINFREFREFCLNSRKYVFAKYLNVTNSRKFVFAKYSKNCRFAKMNPQFFPEEIFLVCVSEVEWLSQVTLQKLPNTLLRRAHTMIMTKKIGSVKMMQIGNIFDTFDDEDDL